MAKALAVIDVQNDYFENGSFPLWNMGDVVSNIEKVIWKANEKRVPVILVQHIVENKGIASFLTAGTPGANIHQRILCAAQRAPVIVKHYADSFFQTNFEKTLDDLKVTELILCGMMTQNCVTHTAISKSAEKYKVTVLTDCCTTVDERIHKIALKALSTRVEMALSTDEIF
ncbi:MAG: cysteine hydrolase family protein [Endomicrobiaceae bacterium]|jgi:nicotinamidase-related amidase|nr:cysteine hydrolase family protein [Endomicrobiaceae bacterium]